MKNLVTEEYIHNTQQTAFLPLMQVWVCGLLKDIQDERALSLEESCLGINSALCYFVLCALENVAFLNISLLSGKWREIYEGSLLELSDCVSYTVI